MLALYANDVLCRVVFGRDFSEGGEYDRHGFQKMLEEYQELLGGFGIGDFFPSMEFMHTLTGTKSRLVHTFRSFDQFFDEVIKDHLSHNNKKDHKDFVDVLLEVQKNEDVETPLTMDNVKAILLDMFAAGTDTTFITLDWGMTELVMNPRVLEKAQAEMMRTISYVNQEKPQCCQDDCLHTLCQNSDREEQWIKNRVQNLNMLNTPSSLSKIMETSATEKNMNTQ
ncbi:unnamed protein product [Fraxinus pennsylvanica]|uniref:Cytochrome P450 n=1 Tax=Fraxinus pennsylvanica TaxID=56036 RepID=A0AAD2DJ38_9LAMI|nr:unnamed protein product [Fraxinus pennsylvanica]